MSKRIIVSLLALIILSGPANAQKNYIWKDQNLSLKSAIELQVNENPYQYKLEGDGLYIEFALLEGMEGLSGLSMSLDSYAESFGYRVNGKAKQIWDIKSMSVARIDGKKAGSNLIICMLASKDYKKHYTCEIQFSEDQRDNVEAIIKSITYGSSTSSVTVAASDEKEEQGEKDSESESTTKQSSKSNVGSMAADFALNDVNGNSVNFSSLKGKTVLLDFWGTWCGPCIQSIPELKKLYDKFGGSDFEIVSVANDQNINKWKNTVSAKGMNWVNLIDQNEKVCTQYEISAFPSLFLIDKQGDFIAKRTNIYEVEEYLNNNFSGQSSKSSNHQTIEYNQNIETVDDSNTNIQIGDKYNSTPIQKLTWKLLSKYSPDGFYILDQFYKTPSEYGGQSHSGDDDFTKWIDGDTEQDIVKSLNTVVHEMDHGFTGRVYLKIMQEANQPIESGDYSSFYLGNKETRIVKHTEVYVSKEINSVFPSNLITSRYETYVYPSEPIMGSQQSGVYGLLDEWNAYYNGTKTSFDLYNYFKEKRDDAKGWAEFFSDYYGTYYAYLEFKSYILVYMIHAKQNYPELYNNFMKNNDLLYSLRKTDEIWKKLINDFKVTRAKIITDLTSRGMDVEENGKFFYINGSGTGNFSEIYNNFQEELKKSEYQRMAQALGFTAAGGPEF